ncbi:MAG: hypothetical protein ACPL3S_04965, partial [Halothiobacillaceae bacterium]
MSARFGNNHVPKRQTNSPGPTGPIPYGFIPVSPQQAVHDAPLWRDGSSRETRYSGELLITLEALTALIVGNHQHKINEQRSELVPQMHDDRVLIGAASLKGMLRSVLSSLLDAPMERVAEHHYTYRPNFGFRPEQHPKRETRAAIVESIGDELTVKLLPENCPVIFVRSDAQRRLGNVKSGDHIKRRCQGVEIETHRYGQSMRLEANDKKQEDLDHLYCAYRGGIDGEGHFAEV